MTDDPPVMYFFSNDRHPNSISEDKKFGKQSSMIFFPKALELLER